MLKKSSVALLSVRFNTSNSISKFTLLAVALSIFISSSSHCAPSPFLAANGHDIRNNFGQGDAVPLRGVNLGSWLLMEGWMCPMDSSGLADNYSVIQTLDNRFGVATEQSLIKTYQNTWITTNDLDNIKALGMNYIRLPFWWGDVQTLDGTWRADAFAQMDWVVTNAWQRGIYTLIDFHGLPGGQSSSDDTGRANQNQYWTSSAYQNQASLIWSNVATHFSGNPAILGYDLINEPVGAPSQAALWSAYNNLYKTVRAADPNHIIIMEGSWNGIGTDGRQLNWQWDVLPPPTQYGWTNVVYSMHAYPGGAPAAEVNKQVNDFNSHQSWNIPCLIGEFNWEDNTASDWKYGTQQFDANNMSWSHWSYKATSGGVPNSWGIYDPFGTWPSKPNIQSDSINTISNDWSQWKTSTAFRTTSFLIRYLGAPLAVTDFYTNNGTMTIDSNSGVLANDQDINIGQSGISLTAILVSNPTNGQLSLDPDGSFTYSPNTGFNGIDTFEYKVFDGYVDSANMATVSLVISNNTATPATQLIWTAQPGLATNGMPFGQQPVLQTADQSGNPTTNGLPATLIITVMQSAGSGPLLGTTNFNIGTSGSNGIVSFANLQINSAGANNQLTALITSNLSTSLLTNGNFNSPDSTATPTGWSTWTVGAAGYANHEIVIPDAGVLGNYDGSYQMTVGATAADGSGGGVYQITPAIAGLNYNLTVDSGVQDWWWPTGTMSLTFYDANNNGLQTNFFDVTTGITAYNTGKPYQQYQLTATAPAGTTQAKVEFSGYGGGSVWFDNAILTESNSVPSLIAATTLPFTVNSRDNQTNAVLNLTDDKNGTFTINFVGTVGVAYYVQMATNLTPPVNWQSVLGSTNTVTDSNGVWSFTSTNSAPQSYYRSVIATP